MKGLIFTDLTEWIELHSERLHRMGKGDLANLFDEFRTAYFTCDDERALALLPILRRMTYTMQEPLFGYVLAYYDAMITIYWLGDLYTGLRRVMAALVSAWRDQRAETICFYLIEVMTFAWLEVDGRGYQEKCYFFKYEPKTHHNIPDDVRKRIRLMHAVGRTHITPGDPASDIISLMTGMEDDWPESYRLAWKAKSYYWQKQYKRAIQLFRRAINVFERDGLRYEANETRIHLAEVYRDLGQWDRLVTAAEEILTYGESLHNQAHRGYAIGLLGFAYNYHDSGAHRESIALYKQAIDILEPLGWERLAASFALDRYTLCLDDDYQEPICESAEADAERLSTSLAADDIYRVVLFFQENPDL